MVFLDWKMPVPDLVASSSINVENSITNTVVSLSKHQLAWKATSIYIFFQSKPTGMSPKITFKKWQLRQQSAAILKFIEERNFFAHAHN